jgi:hypothetical protein
MGLDWFIFRFKYEILKKIGYSDIINIYIKKKVGKTSKNLFYYKISNIINREFIGSKCYIEMADKAIINKIFGFSNEYLDYNDNGNINWHMNPITKVKASNKLPWNKLSDFGEYGDIKLIWEASRFPQIYYFINAYSLTKDERYAKTCIKQILDWLDKNPYPKGVNYKCGQEICFRVISWIMALEYFKEYISTDEEVLIVKNIYTSLLRINANIDYAAKSVRNNHSISEAAGLFIGGLLFPQFKESKKFVYKGLKYLLNEISYQIYSDGSYIQHSFNYQRLTLDVLSLVIFLANIKGFRLPKEIKKGHRKMIEFLNSFIQENGLLPNYGSNDGSNLFPLTGDDYRDFRSSLNLALAVNEGKILFDGHTKLLKFFSIKTKEIAKLKKEIEFNKGGYYILKNNSLFCFIRCHSYKHRPAQNDMFHVDVWFKGKNIFCDTGSYSYNTDKNFKNNFIGVIGHNTIMINNVNHMQQVLNFGYSNWTNAKCLDFNAKYFIGENYAYRKNFGITHKRSLFINENKLKIVDEIKNVSSLINIKQIWNTKSDVQVIDKRSLIVSNCIISSNINYIFEDSYISDYYNSYTNRKRIIFEVNTNKDCKIETIMEFK